MSKIEDMAVEVIDPVSDYQKLMESLFDFEAIRALFKSGFRIQFDAMHAITGPYGHAILEDALGAPKGSVVNGTRCRISAGIIRTPIWFMRKNFMI